MLSKHHLFSTKSSSLLALSRKFRLLFFSALIIVAVRPIAAQMQTRPFAHNGYDRPYLIYRPAHLAKDPAVVFMLGGIGSTARFASRNFGWTQEADRSGFLVVFPEPVATDPSKPANKKNITFWQMRGSRTRILAPNALPVDDDGYLIAVLHDVLRRDHPDRKRVFFAGFSSGSGMVQLLASRHPKDIRAIAAVATPLMDPPTKLERPVGVLYIHGDNDEQFSGFETLSPHFATTPHGNWVTWGYLDGCQKQTAETAAWGVRFSWEGCKSDVPVIADFVIGLGHEWAGSLDSSWNGMPHAKDPLNFTDMAWKFFASVGTK
jgi:poly(3-hydroxybutyrate) depolymerase